MVRAVCVLSWCIFQLHQTFDNYIRWCELTSYQELCAAPLYPRSADAAADDDDDACDDVEDDDVDDKDDEDDDEDDLEDDLDPGP